MSALAFKLLLYLCVWSSILQANGIQNLRYPTRFDNNPLRLGKRQDFLTKSRYFMWKPALNSGQMYPNVKTQAVPLNFNRYGIPPPPMAPIHQNYMFTIPTKVNYPPYQPVKEIDDKRKPGNLHHITIINAIMPKPYLPTVPTHSHPTTTFRNYRTNNKLLYHQYYNNNFGRQNMENLNKLNVQQLQLQQLQQQQQQQQQQHQQQQQQHLQMIYPSTPLAFKVSTPTMEYRHVISYNTKNNNNNIEHEENEINTQVSQCGRKTKNDTNHSASDVLYYYCNNRITNYKNPTQQQQTLVSIQPTTTTSTSTTTTTTTTTEAPPTTPHSTKSARLDFDFFTTEKPIFLPTPNAPMESSFTPITSTTIQKNSIVDLDNDNNFKLQRQKYRPKKYEEDIRPPQQRHRQTATRYDDIKRQQQQYTTAAAATYDDMKFHSFFTIEDAVTRAPEMQVFNDPYQAYRHARRHHHSHQRQTTTTTIKPDTTPATKKPKYKSFFDDLEEEDYIIPEVNQYDYSLFSTPAKSVYHKSKIQNELQFSENNQILEHTHKPTEENAFFAVDEPFQGKPKIRQHNFGLFNAIGSTTYATPAITTYKPYENLRNLFLTTHKIPSSSSAYYSKPISFTTTTETVLRNQEAITERERENTTSNEVRTSTTIPITTTTEKKANRIILKSPLNLRPPTTFKYPKQSRIHKSYTNITSTTTRATPTLKKVPKYQRQYKSKKLKQFKHLFTTSSTTTSTTTTAIPTTTEIPTKRISVRLVPTTSTTEEPTTKKAVITRTVSTTETTKIKKFRQQPSPTTETKNRKKIKSRTSTASTTAAVSDISIRRQSPRRGSKRANITRNEKETVQPTTRKTENKNRRRPTLSSTTTKPLITRTSSNLSTTSTTSSTPMSTSLRTSSSTTTMKSIMRIANSKSRTKLHNNIKTPTKPFKELKGDRQVFDERMSLMSITSTMANIPPLPIEIYFKKSHSAKM